MQNNPKRAIELLKLSIKQFEERAVSARAGGFPILARRLEDDLARLRDKLKSTEAALIESDAKRSPF